MNEKTDFFFVYGSLKIGNFFSERFNAFRIRSEKASVKGYDLFNFGHFPGIIEGKGLITGEVHMYRDVDTVLNIMDRIEGYFGDHEQSLYVRKKEKVITAKGEEIEAYIYIFNRELPSYAKKIESGVW
jgi:gamma-glutamylcyclotransferase (GGCT)/AIG2-like uncharacterized protein YtfP